MAARMSWGRTTRALVGVIWGSGLSAHTVYSCLLVLPVLVPDVPHCPLTRSCCWAPLTLRLHGFDDRNLSHFCSLTYL